MKRRKPAAAICGAAAIISAAFYLAAELTAVMFCASPKNALYAHTISELGIPSGCTVDGAVCDFSPKYMLMNSALIACGLIYIPCYTVIFNKFDSLPKRVICRILAALTGLGVTFVGIFHGGNPALGGLHGLSAATCFLCGNLLAVYTAAFYGGEKFSPFRKAAYALGATGLIGTVLTFVFEVTPLAEFAGVPERAAVYSIILWLMSAGVYALKYRSG